MERIIQKLGIILVMLVTYYQASAYDFEVDGIYYNVLSIDDLTCEVTYNPENRKYQELYFDGDEYEPRVYHRLDYSYPSYSGEVKIPAKVSYKGRDLTVVGIGEYAFLNCRELYSLNLPSTISSIAEISVFKDCIAGAFDYCKINTFTAGNAYTLFMFNRSFSDIMAGNNDTKDNLSNLIISENFFGIIDISYKEYFRLVSIRCEASVPPTFSDIPFTIEQFRKMLIYVPESQMESYRESFVWSKFWDIVSLDCARQPSDSFRVYDFQVNNIYYNVVSEEDFTCEVTHKDKIDYINPIPSYTGHVTIPESASINNQEYKVVGIGEHAFFKCEGVSSISLPSTIEYVTPLAYSYCEPNSLIVKNGKSLDKTPNNLKILIISSDFIGQIQRDFSNSNFASSIILNTNTPPVFTEGNHFSNKQFLELTVWVPEETYTSYQSAEVWKDFWELKAMKSVRTLALNEISLTLEPKQSVQLSVTVSPEDAYDSSVTWSSSNPSVATVTEEGLVTAITKGDAQIMVSANDGSGVKAGCSVHVDLLVKDIQLSDEEIGLEPGNSKQLTVTISPKDAFVQDLVWSSDDENIATVDNQGNVTAHSAGVTNIRATTTDGSNLTATCKVTVANLVKSIIVTPDNLTIKEGETSQLYATVSPENATYKEVIWSSENLDVASVDASGKVTAMSAGTTLIKATATDGSGVYGQCELTVTAETVEYNGICYQRNSLTTLKIVQNSEYPYSGDFFIPETAQFNGAEMTVTEIGDEAFSNCIDLTSVVIPNTIAKVRESAFDGCDKLKFVKICDGSSIEANLDEVFPDSPISELYIGANAVTYNPDSRLLSIVKSMTLGGSVTNLPPKAVFKSLTSFIVEVGEDPIVETEDYCTSSMELISQQTLKDPNTHIYYRSFYLVTYTHLSPILDALQNSTLSYLHIGRDVKQVEMDTSKTYEKIPTTAGSRYQELGYMDEVNYQYQDIIVKSEYCRNPVETIVLNESIVELNVGESVKLAATCTPGNASLTAVDWSSSDEHVVVVDIFGNVTKLADGEASVTAVTTDGSNLSASCKIVNLGAGIDNIVMSTENGFYSVYNLQGIMVLKTEDREKIQQLPAGMYIVNGKKVIIR